MSEFKLKIGQFLFASFNRLGFRLVKSKDLDKSVSEGSIIHLCRQGNRRDEQTFIHSFLGEEKIFTISCVTSYVDDIGRPTSSNRTITIDTRQLEEAFRPFLTQQVPVNLPKSLEEIEVELVTS